jgi:hypothetical protein
VKSVKNFRYVEKTSAECNKDSYLAILHLSRVELHCNLQEKLHRVTWPLSSDYRAYINWGTYIRGAYIRVGLYSGGGGLYLE